MKDSSKTAFTSSLGLGHHFVVFLPVSLGLLLGLSGKVTGKEVSGENGKQNTTERLSKHRLQGMVHRRGLSH